MQKSDWNEGDRVREGNCIGTVVSVATDPDTSEKFITEIKWDHDGVIELLSFPFHGYKI